MFDFIFNAPAWQLIAQADVMTKFVLFALFLSILALDAFNEGYGYRKAIVAFLIHLIPTYIILLVLIVAWLWEFVGSIIFITMALFYFISNNGESFVI